MMKLFKKLDSFSREFRFTYKGNSKYSSALGGIFTVIAMIIILLNGFLIGKDIYFKENPNIVNYEEIWKFYPTTKINYKDNFFAFAITDGSNNFFEDNTVLKIIPVLNMGYFNKKGELKINETHLQITDCLSEFKRLNLSLPPIKDVMKNLKCIKNFDSILSGAWTEKYISSLSFEIFQCSNKSIVPNSNLLNDEDKNDFNNFKNNISNTNLLEFNQEINYAENQKFEEFLKNNINTMEEKNSTNTVCKSQKELKEIIPNLNFNFFYQSVVINNKNFSNPMTIKMNMDWYILGTSLFRTIDYYFNHIIVRTDDGFIFNNEYKDIVKLDYYKHNIDYKVNPEGETAILWCNIYITNKIKFSTREYIKLQNIFANLGGIIKLVMMVFNLFLGEFYSKKMNLKIINKLFDFDQIKNKSKIYQDSNLKDVKLNFSQKNLDDDIRDDKEKIEMIKKKNEYSMKLELINYNDSFMKKNNLYNLCNINQMDKSGKLDEMTERNNILPEDNRKILYSRKKNLLDRLKRINQIKQGNIIYRDNNKIDDHFNEKINKSKENEMEEKAKYDNEIEMDLDMKINNILSIKKKLSFTNFELLTIIFCKCAQKNEIMLKNSLYKCSQLNMIEFTDYLKTIEIQRNFIKLKYLLLNTQQIISFQFMTNPKTALTNIHHEIKDYAVVFDSKITRKNAMNEMYLYFRRKLECNNFDEIDQKIFNVLLPNIKNIIVKNK